MTIASQSPAARDGVVLLHGIMRTKRCMKPLERYLKRHGFSILNLNYPSTRQSIGDIADFLKRPVGDFAATCDTIHFVGFSMGGLIIRAFLSRYHPVNLGRVVMLGTPNGGSEIANRIQRFWLYQKLYGPAGQQLVTDQSAFAALFAPIDYPLGVIAGNRSFDPVMNWLIPHPSDGTVSIASTKIDGMLDHMTVPSGHTFLPVNKKALAGTLGFLRHGRFSDRQDTPS